MKTVAVKSLKYTKQKASSIIRDSYPTITVRVTKYHTIQNNIVNHIKLPIQANKINNLNKNNRGNIITTFNSKDLEFILHYITLTSYYILKKAFK